MNKENKMDVKSSLLVLGLNPTKKYNIRDIETQFKKMALLYHPDKTTINNTTKFQNLCNARDYMRTHINSINIELDENKMNNNNELYEIDTLIMMYHFFL